MNSDEDDDAIGSQGSQKSVCDNTIASESNIDQRDLPLDDSQSPTFLSRVNRSPLSPVINLDMGLGSAKTPVHGNERSFIAVDETTFFEDPQASEILLPPKSPVGKPKKRGRRNKENIESSNGTIGNFTSASKRSKIDPPRRSGRGGAGAYGNPPNPKM